MNSPFDFIISPKGSRYNNSAEVGDKTLILNTEVFNHQYVNRTAKVVSTPLNNPTEIQEGDEIIVHHNIFRRWHDVKGREKNSRSYFKDNLYFVKEDQIFLYKRDDQWNSLEGYCFVKPIRTLEGLDIRKERPLIGIVKYTDGTVEKGDLVGFRPSSEYEFVIDGERMYRVLSNFITIKYEYQGDEEEYNPGWAKSS